MKKAILILAIIFVGHSACADILEFSFDDPVGDHTGIVDVTNLTVSFDNTTGDYEVVLTADSANMFWGNFRINLNLFNPDTGTMDDIPSFFQDAVNDYSLTTPTDTIILTGVHPSLAEWKIGDRVATTSLPFGGGLFRSSVGDLPGGSWGQIEDIIDEGGYATIVPEPATVCLLGLGGMLLRRRS